jgi:hypothetical protein
LFSRLETGFERTSFERTGLKGHALKEEGFKRTGFERARLPAVPQRLRNNWALAPEVERTSTQH